MWNRRIIATMFVTAGTLGVLTSSISLGSESNLSTNQCPISFAQIAKLWAKLKPTKTSLEDASRTAPPEPKQIILHPESDAKTVNLDPPSIVETVAIAHTHADQRSHAAAHAQWLRITTENPPEGVPFYALGFNELYGKKIKHPQTGRTMFDSRGNAISVEIANLSNFSDSMTASLRHPVVTYHDYYEKMHGKISEENLEALFENGIERVAPSGKVLFHIDRLISAAKGRKVILFNLDGVDLAHLESGAQYHDGYTMKELKFILASPSRFNHVRWFRNGRELTYDDIRATFERLRPNLFAQPD